jgi:hypothetical protein
MTYGTCTKGYALTGRYRVQRDGPSQWACYRETERYGSSWERVPYIGTKRYAHEALALAKMSLNRMGPWAMSRGRGSCYWTSQQSDGVEVD